MALKVCVIASFLQKTSTFIPHVNFVEVRIVRKVICDDYSKWNDNHWKAYDITHMQLRVKCDKQCLKKLSNSQSQALLLGFSARPICSSPCIYDFSDSSASAAIPNVICNGEA